MSKASVLKAVKKAYPELEKLPTPKLKIVEDAIIYASKLGYDDLLTHEEHTELMAKLSPKAGMSPATILKAYRLRADMTQSALAGKCGVPQGNISAMEKGTRPIGVNMAKKLAQALKCDHRRLL